MADRQAEFVKQLNGLGVNVSRETMARLETYAALLEKWQAKINLVGPATLPDLWRRHFLDSAQLAPLLGGLLPPLRGKVGKGGDAGSDVSSEIEDAGRALRRAPPHPASAKLASLAKPAQPSPARGEGEFAMEGSGTLVDLGSGAGFPGLVLAILTDWRVHLIDSDQRKCAFLRQVALEAGILDRVTIHAQRFEAVAPFPADVVTARACAPLDDLLGYAAPFLGESGRCVFLKGKGVEEELTGAQAHWTMRLERRESLSDPAGTVLVIDQLQRRKR